MLRVLLHARTIGLLLLLALCATGQTRQAEADGERPKPGMIKGRVVNESGQPLANASIRLSAVGNPNIKWTSTDHDGTFRVTDLTPLRYLITVYLPAYTTDGRETEGPPAEYRIGDSVTFVLIKGGVITGTVATADGDPVVAIGVRAWMVQDARGRPVTTRPVIREVSTDDRGVYRFYGLPAGIYLVMAPASPNDYTRTGINPFVADVPTYAPSSTRDSAAQITVRSGEEVSNVDIRYRGEHGRTISGFVSGMRSEDMQYAVNLKPITSNDFEWNTSVDQQSGQHFVFEGIGDGDYYLTAQSYTKAGERGLSESRLINVRGADITGIELAPMTLASITGRVVLRELKTPECIDKQPFDLKEASISAWHKDTEASRNKPQFVWTIGAPVSPDPQGNITLRNLSPSQYYFQARLTAKDWYLQSISLTPAAPAEARTTGAKPIDATRVWTTVKSGDRLSGLTVTLAQGAASLRGKLALSDGEVAPEKLLVYLVPAETERADDILRFYGAPVSEDGKITLNNLAPGRYWILAQPVVDDAPSPLTKLRWPDETRTRARLRREAEAAKMEIEFKPCQHVVDYELPLKSALPQ